MQVVQFATHFAVVELVDGLRFRLFAVCNHDIREYEVVSKFTVTLAVYAMVSFTQTFSPPTSELNIKTRANSRRTGTSHCELWP